MTKPRIVKPMSAKQRANANRLKTSVTHRVVPSSPAPATSWWIGRTREQLQEDAAAQRARMSTTRFGRTLGHGVIAE
jgi:hypothetical protein